MLKPRADHKIAEHIYRTKGLAALREWHSLPLVEAINKENIHKFMEFAETMPFMDKDVRRNSVEVKDKTNTYITFIHRDDESKATACFTECLSYLPWPDFIIQRSKDNHEYSFVRFCVHDLLVYADCDHKRTDVVCSTCFYGKNNELVNHVHANGDVCGLIKDLLLSNGTQATKLDYMATIAVFVSWITGAGYPVQMVPEMSNYERRVNAKTIKHKPWVRADLPSIVLIDFSTPNPKHGWQGCTHSSPSPHQRRGHWRTYQHERWGALRGQRRWVRPAWVGDREWVHYGTRYKVVEPVEC